MLVAISFSPFSAFRALSCPAALKVICHRGMMPVVPDAFKSRCVRILVAGLPSALEYDHVSTKSSQNCSLQVLPIMLVCD